MKVFILCAGDSKRWEWDNLPKFFVPVEDGERLLNRTIKQLNRYDVSPTIVTHRDDIEEHLSSCSYTMFSPERREYTCDTLRSTASLWDQGKTVILLGDTFYTDGVIRHILYVLDSVSFFGSLKEREIYALTFRDNRRILEALEEVEKRFKEGFHGQLWQLFYAINRFQPDKHPKYIPFKDRMFINVWDDTQDFDSVEDYKKYLRKLKKEY